MPLSGLGDDSLQAGQDFILSLYGTEFVFTAEGNDLRVRDYKNHLNQIWRCVTNQNNRFAFRNRDTGNFLGTTWWGNLACSAPHQQDWECVTLTKVATGGYQLCVSDGDKLIPVTSVEGSRGTYIKVVAGSNQMIGLHRYSPSPFQRFSWVIPSRLARSSAPHYRNQDSDQRMDAEAIQYLVNQRVASIISFNKHPLPQEAINQLSARGITYNHIPVVDFGAPTLQQLYQLRGYYESQTSTLIYCGYGHGRTGTAVSALQLFTNNGDVSEETFRDNHVEVPSQFSILRELEAEIVQ